VRQVTDDAGNALASLHHWRIAAVFSVAFPCSRRSIVAVSMMLALCAGIAASTAGLARAEQARNPFGAEDPVDPVSAEVLRLAEKVVLRGDADDPNAPQWAPATTVRVGAGVVGEWFGRWEAGSTGTARVRVIGDRLFALYTDVAGRMAGRSWLLEAKMLADGRLLGSWVQIGDRSDTGPFVGRIVDDERIDGVWSWDGRERWDFRRRLK
jgi:hypothetical protein